MSDDTRDIAIRGKSSADAAHHRLDKINGQIKKLGDSHEAMRHDFNEALNDPDHGLVPRVVDLTATVRTTLKVAGAIAAAAIAITTGVTVYVLTHDLHQTRPPQLVQTARQ
jgi:hypothetical protein